MQSERWTGGTVRETAKPALPMGYWNELEIFRCADGCQKLAKKIAEEITSTDKERKLSPAKLLHRRAVTNINIVSKQGVVRVGSKQVMNDKSGRLADGPPLMLPYEYVILAIPPSVWADVQIIGRRQARASQQ